MPTIAQSIQPQPQPPANHNAAPAAGGRASAFFGIGQIQTPPLPSYRQSFSSLATPPRRRGSYMDDGSQRVSKTHVRSVCCCGDGFAAHTHTPFPPFTKQKLRASFSMGGGRDALMAATARALPVTLTYAPYGFCLVSRFPFVNALRAPLAALFEQVRQHDVAFSPAQNQREINQRTNRQQ